MENEGPALRYTRTIFANHNWWDGSDAAKQPHWMDPVSTHRLTPALMHGKRAKQPKSSVNDGGVQLT
jgi:hypothetical protein